MKRVAPKRALIVSVGYGEGHHAAARALAQEFCARDWSVRVIDPCKMAHPFLFELTRRFYQFCVRRAPWLWAITYEQTDTADWSVKPFAPGLRGVTETLAAQVKEFCPDVVLCTYPLYAHMLDALRLEGRVKVPYAVVVTDALEISRPWMVNKAPLIFLPDEYSLERVSERYALDFNRMAAVGFPVKREFHPDADRGVPDAETLRIVYGAYAPLGRVQQDLAALIARYPTACITVIAGAHCADLLHFASERVAVVPRTDRMHELFARAHFYIGKAGAATVFEAYASHLPVLVNYALPGQEQGNLELLLQDGAGCRVRTTADMLVTIEAALAHGAAGWCRMRDAMAQSGRGRGAKGIADVLEKRFLYEE